MPIRHNSNSNNNDSKKTIFTGSRLTVHNPEYFQAKPQMKEIKKNRTESMEFANMIQNIHNIEFLLESFDLISRANHRKY